MNPYRRYTGSVIPEWLEMRGDVSPGAKICYARLARFAGKDGVSKPRTEVLAEAIGVSSRQVKRYTSELEQMNLIHIKRRGRGMSNVYYFIDQEVTHTSHQEVTHTSHQEVTHTSHQEVTHTSHPIYEENQFKRINLRESCENARAKKNEDFEVFDLSENDTPELTHSDSKFTGAAPNFYEAAREVIKYLNAAAGFDIYPGAGKGTKLIIDRMQEGATYQDCCAVIDLKVSQTRKRRRDGDFIFKREWLYPTTLFKPDKFEKYLQEVKDLKNGQHQHAAPTTAAEIAEATRAYHKANGIDVSQLLFGHSSTDD